MRLKDLETYLKRHRQDFFQFAMMLTGDEDISEKIIIDSEYLLITQEREEIKSLIGSDKNPQSFFNYSRRFVYSSVFRIAKKNNLFQAPHERSNEYKKIQEKAFWILPMEQRAVLCLRQRLNLNKDEISDILDLTKVEYFNLLNLGRESILRNAGALKHDVRDTF